MEGDRLLVAPRDHWVVSSFSTEQGLGRIKDIETGEEAAFSLEAWSPCDPSTARALQDSESRRRLLLPRTGEPVVVEWKTSRLGREIPAAVARREALECGPPPMTFKEWLEGVGRHVTDVASWRDDEWAVLSRYVDEDIDDTIQSLTS